MNTPHQEIETQAVEAKEKLEDFKLNSQIPNMAVDNISIYNNEYISNNFSFFRLG